MQESRCNCQSRCKWKVGNRRRKRAAARGAWAHSQRARRAHSEWSGGVTAQAAALRDRLAISKTLSIWQTSRWPSERRWPKFGHLKDKSLAIPKTYARPAAEAGGAASVSCCCSAMEALAPTVWYSS
jgi:hypothetical protein